LITVNCILNAGERIQMEISSSKPYPSLTDSNMIIKDAKVRLFEDNNYIADLIYSESYQYQRLLNHRFIYHYSLNGFIPVLNHAYSIKITAPGFPEVTSNTTIPQSVTVISIDTNTVFTVNGDFTVKALECRIKFKDPKGIKNFYKLEIIRSGLIYECPNIHSGKDCMTSLINYPVNFICHDLNVIFLKSNIESPVTILPEEENDEQLLNNIFLSDATFDGETYVLTIMMPIPLIDFAYPQDPSEKFRLRKINFKFYSINEEYYKYARSNYAQINKRNDMFSEPYHVFSNINNGVGIFSGVIQSVDSSIVLPVYYATLFK
jgi:hypothetical protein